MAKKQATGGTEVEMSGVGENSRLVEEPEFNVRPCSEPDCMNEAKYRCQAYILFKKHGCGAVICEEHRNQSKLCSCFDQKELIVCQKCEPVHKEKARKRHFWIPALIFIIVNVITWYWLIIDRLGDMQDV